MSSGTQRGIAGVALGVMVALFVVGAVSHVHDLLLVGVIIGAIPALPARSYAGRIAGRCPRRALTDRVWASPVTGFDQRGPWARRRSTIRPIPRQLLRSSRLGAGSDRRCTRGTNLRPSTTTIGWTRYAQR
jgi:hypothetical protein